MLPLKHVCGPLLLLCGCPTVSSVLRSAEESLRRAEQGEKGTVAVAVAVAGAVAVAVAVAVAGAVAGAVAEAVAVAVAVPVVNVSRTGFVVILLLIIRSLSLSPFDFSHL